MRKEAREIKAGAILQACDAIRDDVLPELGVRLEDKEDEPTVIKLVDRAELAREREQKKAAEAARAAEKEKKRAEAAARAAAAEEAKKVPPAEMFKADPKFSKFDEKVGH